MKQLALFLAVLAWLAIRAQILLTYWNANPRKLVLVVAIPASVLLVWWFASEDYLGVLGIPAVLLVAADGLFSLNRLVRIQYRQAIDLLKQPHQSDEASQ